MIELSPDVHVNSVPRPYDVLVGIYGPIQDQFQFPLGHGEWKLHPLLQHLLLFRKRRNLRLGEGGRRELLIRSLLQEFLERLREHGRGSHGHGEHEQKDYEAMHRRLLP